MLERAGIALHGADTKITIKITFLCSEYDNTVSWHLWLKECRRLKKRELLFQYRRYWISTVTFYKVFLYIIVCSKMTYKEQHAEKQKLKKNYLVVVLKF